MSKCPLCGSDGDDLVFKFYCSNSGCRNYVPGNGVGKQQTVANSLKMLVMCGSCGRVAGPFDYKGPFPQSCPACSVTQYRDGWPWWYRP
jgi:hypothetical protein